MKQVVERLAEITSNIVLTPLETIEHMQLIIKAAAILQSMGVTSEVSKLKDYLKKGIHETQEILLILENVDLLPPPLNSLLAHAYLEMSLFVGENVLELLEQEQMVYFRNKFHPHALGLTGGLLYYLQRSLLHYRELVKIPQPRYKRTPALCFRLMNMGSFECLPLLVPLMITNAGKAIISFNNILYFTHVSSQSSKDHYLRDIMFRKYTTDFELVVKDSLMV